MLDNTNRFPNMFKSIKIGPMEVKNRFVVAPMCNNYANPDGNLSERSLAYYTERAKGGFGLITIEATVVDERAKGGPKKSCLFRDEQMDGLAKVIESIHAYGAKASVQLQHAGPEGKEEVTGYPLRAASAIISEAGRDMPIEISKEEIYELVGMYGNAALRAKKAGADAVEVHCAHGYLINSFLSPRTNKRIDEFGGSFENRMRFPRLIIESIREKCGEDLAIICRINSSDEVEGGLSVNDSASIAAYLEKCGVDGLNISRAVHIKDEFMWAPTIVRPGFNVALFSEIKKAVEIPIIAIGRFTEPYLADMYVEEGRCDLVAFGRQSIADPELPNKAAAGELEKLNHCIACLQGCVHYMYSGAPVTCLVNPLVGREAELKEAKEKKEVMVIGGGVGGMYAAFTASRRGHKVTLYESTNKLGGQMRLAAYPPGKGDLTNMIRSYIEKLDEYGVDVKMNTEVNVDMVKEIKPDAVIVATGAKPLILPISGINDSGLVNAVDVLDGLEACGEKVLVVGGGMVGSETADFLGERNHDVTVVELRDEIGMDVIPEHRKFLMKSFDEYKIKSITGSKVSEFFPGGIKYETTDGEMHTIDGFDTVVLAMGARNYDPISEELRVIVDETYVIGDAVKARRALDATREALNVALEI